MSPYITDNLFCDLYEQYYDKIFNYIFRQVYHRERAEDLTSGTFMKALQYLKKNKRDIENFNAWIYRIATNEVLKDHRKRRGKTPVSLDDEISQLGELVQDKRPDIQKKISAQIDIRRALKQLKPKDALLVELYFYENKKYTEIAAVLKVNETALRSRLHRALKKLKGYWQN
jgi:RNA polymerase sigma-70 factor (ECF subfamily)